HPPLHRPPDLAGCADHENAHASVPFVPHVDVLHHHLVVRGGLDDEPAPGDLVAVERVHAAAARDVHVVADDFVVDADAKLAVVPIADVVVREEGDLAHRRVAQRDADARVAAAALLAADAAAFLAIVATVVAAIIVAAVAVVIAVASVVVRVEHLDVADLHLVVGGDFDDQLVAADAVDVELVHAPAALDVDVAGHVVTVDADVQLSVGALADVVVGEEANADHRRGVERDGDALAVLPAFRAADAAVLGIAAPLRGVRGDRDESEKDEQDATHLRDLTFTALQSEGALVDIDDRHQQRKHQRAEDKSQET